MSTLGIQAEKLTKHYTINLANQRHDALRDQFSYGFQLLLRRDGRQHTETFWALTTFRVRSNSEVSWGLLDETAPVKIFTRRISKRLFAVIPQFPMARLLLSACTMRISARKTLRNRSR